MDFDWAVVDIAKIRAFPGALVLIILIDRYILGGLFLLLQRNKKVELMDEEEFNRLRATILVPMYNEGKSIQKTVASFRAQTFPRERLKFIIIDDCSSDDSADTVEEMLKDDDQGRLFRNPFNQGKRKSLAYAVHECDSEIVISVDSDVVLDSRAIEELMNCFRRKEVSAVGGRVCVSNANKNWLTMMQAIKYFIGYEFLKGLENRFGSVMCLSGCLTAYRKEVLIAVEDMLLDRRIGLTPIKYGEDRYLTRQLVQRGYKTYLHLKSICYSKAPEKLAGFFAQQVRWRRSNIVDYLGAARHVLRIQPIIAIHYFCLAAAQVIYPVFIISKIFRLSLDAGVLGHLAILGILGCYYRFATRGLPKEVRVNPAAFLAMAVVMPVTYILLTPLGLFTLDTSSWETRKPVKTPASSKVA